MLIFIAGGRIAGGFPSSSFIGERTQRILQAYNEGAVFEDTPYSHRHGKLTLGIDHPLEAFN